MSVQPRKRKTGTVYYVTNVWNGKPVWEKSGTSKRQAEIDDRAMKKAIAAGTYVPKSGLKRLTMAEECHQLLLTVTGPSQRIYSDRLRLHVLSRPWLADLTASEVEAAHVEQLVQEMRAERAGDARRISDQTIANVLEALRLVFSRAIKAKRLTDNPVTVADHKLEPSQDEREPYTATEAAILTRHASIRWPVRVLNALALYTGQREGEVCGCLWSDVELAAPLACLHVRRQYDGRPLKTKTPRRVPVHTELASILDEWARVGFELHVGRKPTPSDPIVPCVYRGEARNYTKTGYYQAFVDGCRAAGVQPKTLHSTRHTFITLCRRADCNDAKLREITHGKAKSRKRDITERYTHRDWAELCGVVSRLSFDAIDEHQHAQIGLENKLFLTSRWTQEGDNTVDNSPKNVPDAGCPASGQTSHLEHDLCGFENTRQESRQQVIDGYRDLAEANAKRKRSLETLRRVDLTAAAPGLFLVAALNAAYSGDMAELEQNLEAASAAIG